MALGVTHAELGLVGWGVAAQMRLAIGEQAGEVVRVDERIPLLEGVRAGGGVVADDLGPALVVGEDPRARLPVPHAQLGPREGEPQPLVVEHNGAGR